MVEVTKIEFECFEYPYPPSVINFLFEYFKDYFFVAEDECLVGYIVGVPKKDEGHLVSLAVRRTSRRRKVGSLLLRSLCQKLGDENKRKIILEVRAENKEAQTFYTRHGFKVMRVIQQYYENGEDAYSMERNLD
jgi:ribosomal-protein-alanine N-acetyltransferase